MGEQLRYNYENEKNDFDQEKSNEKLRSIHEAAANKREIKDKQEKLNELHEKIERKAKESKELKQEIENKHTNPNRDSNKSWHQSPPSASRTLHMAQRQLKPTSRAFSKFIHNPTVETVSDVTGGTIARPYGLLWAGILAFFVPLTVLMICKHYGYTYNAFIAIASFSGGFILGLLIEASIKALATKKLS